MQRAWTLAIALMILVASPISAQQLPREPPRSNLWFVRAGYSPAVVLATSQFASDDDRARAMTIEIGRQTDGTRDWHHVYNYPSYGVGLYAGRFGRDRELGRPLAAYGFFSWPFPIADRVQVTSDLGLGVTWRWNEFHPHTNPTNTALGSDAAYHIDWGLYFHYLASSHTSMFAGLNVTHWSNGGTKLPNLGLAVVGPKVGMRYNLAPQVARPSARREDLPRFNPSWEFVAGGAGSPRSGAAAAFNVTAGIQRQFYQFGKGAAGVDATRDGQIAAGVYGGYEHVIARFSVIAQFGQIVWREFEDPDAPRLYQRYGSRFHLTDHLWTTFAVRTVKLRRARFVEFGLGYRSRW
jgi:hypothetical protein